MREPPRVDEQVCKCAPVGQPCPCAPRGPAEGVCVQCSEDAQLCLPSCKIFSPVLGFITDDRVVSVTAGHFPGSCGDECHRRITVTWAMSCFPPWHMSHLWPHLVAAMRGPCTPLEPCQGPGCGRPSGWGGPVRTRAVGGTALPRLESTLCHRQTPRSFHAALRKKTLLFLFPGPFHEEIFLRCCFRYYFYLINPDY